MNKLLITTFLVIVNLVFHVNPTISQTHEWALNIGGNSSDISYSLTVDDVGNVYSTGRFVGTVDFDPGAGTVNLTSNGIADLYVAKFDASGNFIWAINIGGDGYNSGDHITVDANGNVYLTGFFDGTTDFDPGPGISNVTAVGVSDIFIIKLNSNGDLVWFNTFGSSNYDYGACINIDNAGDVYLSGLFYETIDFDPGAGVVNLTSAGNFDIFIAKYNSSGNLLWAKSMGSTGMDAGGEIDFDNANNLYMEGIFNGTVDFDPGAGIANSTSAGNRDVFISKLDPSGNLIWVKTFGNSSDDDECSGLGIDKDGNVYAAGKFSGTVDYNPNAGFFNMTSSGNTDVCVLKLDNSGNFVWAKQISGSGNAAAYSLAIDKADDVYVGGWFTGTFDFNPGVAAKNLASNGGRDIFVTKLNKNGEYEWAQSYGSSPDDDEARRVYVDKEGNVFSGGHFYNTVDFDASAGTDNLTSNGSADIYINKVSQCLPIAEYPFNGNANELTGWGNPGATAGVLLEDDRFENPNSAYSFDGINDSIVINGGDNLGAVFNGYHPFTISMWYFMDTKAGYGRLLAKGTTSNPEIQLVRQENTDSIAFVIYSNATNRIGIQADNALDLQKWSNITLVYDGGIDFNAIKVYKNGQELITESQDFGTYTGMNSNNSSLLIGHLENYYSQNDFWLGEIDDISLYSCALSAFEIDSLWRQECVPIVTQIDTVVCAGNNVFAQGANQTLPGNYYDTLTAVNGCDSIVITTIYNFNNETNFTLSSSSGTILCAGDSTELVALVTDGQRQCSKADSSSAFLPDGSGASYDTPLTINCYDNESIGNKIDLEGIWFNLEHSYAGDLQIELECPNGTVLPILAANTLGNLFFGEPVDPATGEGKGYSYWINNSPSNVDLASAPTTSITYTDTQGNSATGTVVNSGSYAPIAPWSTLNGCPVNGIWTLRITDNLASDDGYLQGWSIHFTDSFALTFDTLYGGVWSGNNIVSTQDSIALVFPDTVTDYSFSIVNNNGCTKDTTYQISINSAVSVTHSAILPSCNGSSDGSITANPSGGVTNYSYLWENSSTSNTINNITAGSYSVTISDGLGCNSFHSLTISEPPLITATYNITICEGDSILVGGEYQSNAGNYQDTIPSLISGCDSIVTTTLFLSDSSTNVITGFVLYNGLPINSGKVKLIKKDGNSPQSMLTIDSMFVNTDGSYMFDSLNSGNYLVKALGDTAIYRNVATYGDSTNHWQKAVMHTVSNGCMDTTTGANVYLIDFNTTIGFGSMNGKLINGGPVRAGDPIPGIDISLQQIPGGIIKGGGTTDDNGDFTLKNIEAGDYKLHVDMLGYFMDTTHVVSYDGSNMGYDVTVCVYDTTTTMDLCAKTLTIITEIEAKKLFEVFPNPAHQSVTINHVSTSEYNLRLLDVTGRCVINHNNIIGPTLLDVSMLQSGVYTIQILTKGIEAKQQLIIQH